MLSARALAKRVIRYYTDKGVLQKVGDNHHSQMIYTVSQASLNQAKKEAEAQPAQQQKGGKTCLLLHPLSQEGEVEEVKLICFIFVHLHLSHLIVHKWDWITYESYSMFG